MSAGTAAAVVPGAARPGRALFGLEPDVVWVNGGFNAPIPTAARGPVMQAFEQQLSPRHLPPDAVYSTPDQIRRRLSQLLGFPAEMIGVTNSTVFATGLLAHAIDWKAGDRLLLAADEFPANLQPWLFLERRGVVCEKVGTPGRALAPEHIDAALAKPGRVRALAVAATHYLTGDVTPLEALSERLHARDAWMFVDASQAAGAMALDWTTVGADAVYFSGYKWLLGPYGTGALWASPELMPAMAAANGNWWGLTAAPDLTRILETWPRDYVSRGIALDAGQSASFFNIAAWTAGLDTLIAIDMPEVEHHLRMLQDRLVDGLRGTPLVLLTTLSTGRRSPLLMFGGDFDATALSARLAERGAYASARAGRLRVSPGVWNDEEDIDRFAGAVREVLA